MVVALGVLLVAAAVAFAAYNIWDSWRAGEASDAVVSQLEVSDDTPANASTWDRDATMPTVTIDGRTYIGVLSVPALGLELPVMSDWSYENLRVSPCRYSGSYFADDLVICGHNYARHFSPLRNVAIGTDVYLTNPEGMRIHYIVSNRETVAPTAIERMVDNDQNSTSPADWDMTLFTCNLGGQTRCAVRCLRQAD